MSRQVPRKLFPKAQRRLISLIVWIVAEILLNLCELDTWADYSEFVFEKKLRILMLT